MQCINKMHSLSPIDYTIIRKLQLGLASRWSSFSSIIVIAVSLAAP